MTPIEAEICERFIGLNQSIKQICEEMDFSKVYVGKVISKYLDNTNPITITLTINNEKNYEQAI